MNRGKGVTVVKEASSNFPKLRCCRQLAWLFSCYSVSSSREVPEEGADEHADYCCRLSFEGAIDNINWRLPVIATGGPKQAPSSHHTRKIELTIS